MREVAELYRNKDNGVTPPPPAALDVSTASVDSTDRPATVCTLCQQPGHTEIDCDSWEEMVHGAASESEDDASTLLSPGRHASARVPQPTWEI